MSTEPLANTDRELWREREGDYYADKIFVTQAGAVGINCGGHVKVAPLRAWFGAMEQRDALLDAMRFIRELAGESLESARVGTGEEVALRHIGRRAGEAIAKAKGTA